MSDSKLKYAALSNGSAVIDLFSHEVITVSVVHVFTVLLDSITYYQSNVAPESVKSVGTGESVRILLV